MRRVAHKLDNVELSNNGILEASLMLLCSNPSPSGFSSIMGILA